MKLATCDETSTRFIEQGKRIELHLASFVIANLLHCLWIAEDLQRLNDRLHSLPRYQVCNHITMTADGNGTVCCVLQQPRQISLRLCDRIRRTHCRST